jgi:hypothetical protein
MAYVKLDLLPFTLALFVVTIPVWILERQAPKWVWPYVFLIVLMMLTVNYPGITQFSNFLKKEY